MIHAVTLVEFARLYLNARDVSAMYAGTVLRRAKAFQEFIGEPVPIRLLTEHNVNAFLASMAGIQSPWTLKSYRGDLLTLWRAAADDGLCNYPVLRKIRRERLDALTPDCYSSDDARKLLDVAGALKGGLPNGVPKRSYWPAAIRAGWDSGLRRGDLWKLRRDQIRDGGTALIAQSKTGRVAVVRFRPSTMAALESIPNPQPLYWPLSGWAFGEHFREIVRAAKLRKSTFKFIRRASGSYVELQQPGAGHKHLGHTGPQTFNTFYDARLWADTLPQPPEL